MDKLKALLKAYFADYEAHQEHSGRGSGKPDVTTDELAEAIVAACSGNKPAGLSDVYSVELPPTTMKRIAALQKRRKNAAEKQDADAAKEQPAA